MHLPTRAPMVPEPGPCVAGTARCVRTGRAQADAEVRRTTTTPPAQQDAGHPPRRERPPRSAATNSLRATGRWSRAGSSLRRDADCPRGAPGAGPIGVRAPQSDIRGPSISSGPARSPDALGWAIHARSGTVRYRASTRTLAGQVARKKRNGKRRNSRQKQNGHRHESGCKPGCHVASVSRPPKQGAAACPRSRDNG